MIQLDDLTSNKISALINIQDWQLKQEKGRAVDQEHLYRRLNDLESNQYRLEEVLGTPHPHHHDLSSTRSTDLNRTGIY